MNPAARLLEFVLKAISVPGHLTAVDGWSKVLGLEEVDYIGIYAGIADIIQLTIDTRKAISGLNGYNQPLFLQSISTVLSGINAVNLQGTWASVTNQFDPLTVQGLQFCSTVLDQHSNETSLNDDDIKSWLQEIDNLLDSITTSEIPDQLKIFFVEHLEKLRLALLHYWIFGTVGVQSSVERTIGAIFIRRSQFSTIADSSFWTRFLDLLTNVANAITVSQGLQALGSGIRHLLSSAS